MQEEGLTARQLWAALKEAPTRRRFGSGRRAAPVNLDLRRSYTDLAAFPATAYETELPDGSDCGVRGTRSDTPDSLHTIEEGPPRAALDPRLQVAAGDVVIRKRTASAFFGTNLRSLLTFHGVDAVVATGGSTSGCARATVVEGPSCGFRAVVPEECVADRHESPHFANLHDMAVKYADVLPVEEVLAGLAAMPGKG